MTDFIVKDKLFNNSYISNYHSVIRLNGNFFSKSFYCPKSKKIIYYQKGEIIDNKPLIETNKQHLQKEIILIDTQYNTLTPTAFHFYEKQNNLLKFVYGENFNETYTDTLFFDSIQVIYAIDGKIQTHINKIDKKLLRSTFSIILDSFLSLYKTSDFKSSILTATFDNYFYLFLISNNKLLLANTLKYKNIDDILYHNLNLYDKFTLDKKETAFYFLNLSQLFENQEIKKTLNIFGIKNNKILLPPPKDAIGYKFHSIEIDDLFLHYKTYTIENNRR